MVTGSNMAKKKKKTKLIIKNRPKRGTIKIINKLPKKPITRTI